MTMSGCNRHSDVPGQDRTGPVVKIAVMSDGQILADGAPVTLQTLRSKLRDLGERHGVVWYYRELPGSTTPPPQAKMVIQAIIDAQLPVRLSSRPDYSDSIGADGLPTTP